MDQKKTTTTTKTSFKFNYNTNKKKLEEITLKGNNNITNKQEINIKELQI